MLLKKEIVLLMLTALIMFSFGCDVPQQGVDEFDLLSEAGDTYYTSYTTPANAVSPNISITDLFAMINDGDDILLLDWRSAEDYAAGHIIGAENKAITDLDEIIPTLPTDTLIVNICYTGQNASFATAAMNLVGQDEAYAGLEARNLLFGMCSVTTDATFIPKTDKWVTQIAEDEFELVQTPSTTDTVNEFPEISTGSTTVADIIMANLDEATNGWSISAADVYAGGDEYFVVNYWPEAEYDDPGHIPGAYQFTPKMSLRSDEDLNLLPTDKPIVIYCYTGQTSAQVTAYLRLLGYEAYSLLYGVNGFAYGSMPGHKYAAPENDYSSIIE